MKYLQVLWVVFFWVISTPISSQPLIQPSNNLNDCVHHAPFGFPQVTIMDRTHVCRSGYALMHDNQARVSPWVIYVLRSDHTIACGERPDRFTPDPLIPSRGRSTPRDYARSGYDQGHLAPNADQSWHPQVQQESFYLSNVAPQYPSLNRQLWNQLEQTVRSWSHARGDHVIITGVIYRTSDRTIGFNQVQVPTHFYKIVTHVESGHTWAFLADNNHVTHRDIRRIQSSVFEIQQLTTVRFQQPDNPRLIRDIPQVSMLGYNRARSANCSSR